VNLQKDSRHPQNVNEHLYVFFRFRYELNHNLNKRNYHRILSIYCLNHRVRWAYLIINILIGIIPLEDVGTILTPLLILAIVADLTQVDTIPVVQITESLITSASAVVVAFVVVSSHTNPF